MILTDKKTIQLKKGSSEEYQCNSLQIGERVQIKEHLSRKENMLISTESNTLKDLEIRTIKRGLQRFTLNTRRILMLLHSKLMKISMVLVLRETVVAVQDIEEVIHNLEAK